MILLADVGMEFGMTKRSRRILDEIMPQVQCRPALSIWALLTCIQVINGDDLEQRALACFVFARTIIASADDDSAGNVHLGPASDVVLTGSNSSVSGSP